VTPFGWRPQAVYLESLGARCKLRRDASGEPALTDEHNLVLDCDFGPIPEPERLALQLQARAGMVAHGLFVGLAHEVVVAGAQGVRELKRTPIPPPGSERRAMG
jgi:ribose 5-phosphate isomerase A